MPKPIPPKLALNLAGYGFRFAKDWTPSAVQWGVVGGTAAIYFTDNWLGHKILRYVPVIGNRYQGFVDAEIAAAAESD